MILVTGALGFIGSHLVDLLEEQGKQVVALDNFGYAANATYYDSLKARNIPTEIVDLTNDIPLEYIFRKYDISTVYHLAAETHVDNSIIDVAPFIQSNIIGTANLLKAVTRYPVDRFIHISTDEVYGHVASGSTNESTPYHTRNPYSATKAASNHLVTAWHHTYNLPAIITHCSNNYGPRQHQEKMIPTIIRSLQANKPVPVYGDGLQIRDWLYVKDHCLALTQVANKGTPGEVYNIGQDNHQEITNIELVKMICDLLDKPYSLITHVEDRKGHDRRYSIDCAKIQNELLWNPQYSLQQGLELTLADVVPARSAKR